MILFLFPSHEGGAVISDVVSLHMQRMLAMRSGSYYVLGTLWTNARMRREEVEREREGTELPCFIVEGLKRSKAAAAEAREDDADDAGEAGEAGAAGGGEAQSCIVCLNDFVDGDEVARPAQRAGPREAELTQGDVDRSRGRGVCQGDVDRSRGRGV
jgi:hypothetical protein